jgi:hypothetical protein
MIPILTHDPDYVLVKEQNTGRALGLLKKAGHELIDD